MKTPRTAPSLATATAMALALASALLAPGARAQPAGNAPAATPAPAASTPLPSPLVAFANANDAACRQLVPPLLARPDFEVVLKRRPVPVASVCGCVRGVLQADPRLVAQFDGAPAEVDARLRVPEVNSYLAMRIVSAALSCTSQEMERSLAAAPLPH